jgi:ATP-binding cassette subfamily B protein
MWKYIKGNLLFLTLSALCMVVEVMVDLIQPRIMTQIVDDGVLGAKNGGVGDMHLILVLGLVMLGLIVLGFLGGSLCSVFANIGGERAGNEMRKDSFQRIMSFSFPQMDRFGAGALITRVTNDITQVQNMIMMLVRGMIRTSFFFVGSICFMFALYPRFGQITLCALPFIVGVMVLCVWKAGPGFSKMQEQLDALNAIMQEDVSGIRIIKACVRETYEKFRFGKANNELLGTQLHVLVIFAFMNPMMNLMMYVVVILVLLVGSIHVQSGALMPGAIMGAITYTTQLLQSILNLVMLFQNISRGRASWKRVRRVLETEPELKDGDFDGQTRLRGQIEFRDVSFAYPGSDKPVLQHIDLSIRPGETLAIMGATGCGKSTLVSLIPRFYDVTEGAVLVDGVDVREYRQKALRERISIALQKSELFSLSVEDNIRWGGADATRDAVHTAAKTAQADEFVSAMPDGYASVVAERGMSLSGGQRQRVSIARTVLKDAEVFIFDDATSALDLKTEAAFYAALEHSHPDSTKIIVAQRVASVRRADRIALIENGTIAACGSHEELLGSCAIYEDIWRSQMGEQEVAEHG